MNCIVPFTKNVDFKTNIGEVSSISLEHEYNVSENVVLGNFIIFGSYKTHEVSVNTENFSFTLPFDLSLKESVEESTLEFNIDNFTYEVIKPNTLKVDIDYIIKAEEKPEEKESIFEEEPSNIKEVILEELRESEKGRDSDIFAEEIEVITNENSAEDVSLINEENKSNILSFAKSNEDSYISYKVHLVKEEETIETLCKLYGKTEIELQSYNIDSKFLVGEKILIAEDE